MSIEWDSLSLGGGKQLKTVGPVTKNARRANSVWRRYYIMSGANVHCL